MHPHYDYLIIGGGVAGVMAAETIREHNADVHIAIVSDEPHVLYSRVLLPAYVKRRIPRSKLFLRTAEDFTNKKIDMYHEEHVVSIDPKHKEIALAAGKTLAYEKILLATGGRAKDWGKPEDQDIIYRLQTIDDADRLFEALPFIHNPLVVGSSFISLEFLEIFLERKIMPRILARGHHFFAHLLDEQGSALMQENFVRLKIRADYSDTIARIDATPPNHPSGLAQAPAKQVEEPRQSVGREVTTKRLQKLSVDAIAVGIGIDRNLDYARAGGIEIGEQGIKVNAYLETNQPDVFAAGDVAEYYESITQTYCTVGNWTNAVLQGKRAGLNMIGMRDVFSSVPSYSITNLGFQITALGDTSYQEETEVRIDTAHKRYARFFFKGDHLRGAVLINRFSDKTHCSKLIEGRVDLSQWRGQFSNNLFDIHTIPVVL